MDMKELLGFINEEKIKLDEKVDISEKEKILTQVAKISEELGEFINEILLNLSLARDEKLQELDKKNINNEFADVIISSMIVAKLLNIDIESALENRIKILKERGNRWYQ
ncbi:MAG: hypothetical protein J7K26_00315 [Candidatus Aenigmarchaeota archaeon]|nr:hypothetical protein [Candidatus Aenigmarchaeota archaeon]